jgi:hypothetical protein
MELHDQQDCVSSGAGFAVIAVKEFAMFRTTTTCYKNSSTLTRFFLH